MPIWLDHAIFAFLAAFLPIWAITFGFRRLKRATVDELPRVRLSVYRRAMVMEWTLSALVLALWAWRGRGWETLGIVPRLTPGLIGVAAGLAIVVIYLFRQRSKALADDESLSRIRDQLRRLELMLPHTAEELRIFYRLSVTAGVCEELLYRGFLLWYLGHWFGPLPAVGVGAVLFGIGHSYQGTRGILLTAAVGAFMGAIYLVTGSIVAPMVIHALMDIHSGHLAYVAFRREREALAEPPPIEPTGGETVHDPIV